MELQHICKLPGASWTNSFKTLTMVLYLEGLTDDSVIAEAARF